MMGAWSRSSDNLNKLPGRESFADHADQARRGGLNGKQQNGGASASASRANSILTSACRLRGNAAYRNFPQSSLVSLMSAMKNALPTGLSLKRFGPVGSVLRHKNLLLSILRKLPPHHHAERRKVLPCFCRRDPSGIAYEPFCCLDRIGSGQTSCRPAVN